MANTYADYTGDGSETDFAITFDYIKTAHVAVEINDGPAGGTNKWVRKTLTSDYTVVTSPAKKVVFNSAPANLVKVRVLRDSDANTGIVDFANGSVLTETELDNSYQHNRYLAEEAEEGKTGGALTKNETSGQFDADALRLENLADPDSDDDAVNKGYADNRYVDVAGDTMTGALNLVDPTADDHAAKKKYVDDQDALQVTKSGDTMSGQLNMGSNKITNLGTPTSSLDAATKDYVDDTITTSFATGSPPPGNEIGTSAIEDDAVTFAKLQNLAQNTVIGSVSVGSNDPKALSMTELRAALNVEDGATADQTASEIKTAYESNSDTNAFTDAEKSKLTNIEANANNYSHPNHSGDVTSVGDGAITIANDAVTFAKMQNINTAKVIGRTTASSGDPEEVSILDEDAMTSNSATALATQQSIKAYVDAQTVSKYASSWFNNTTGLANGGTYSFTHNLGTTETLVEIWMATSSAGANPVKVDAQIRLDGVSLEYGGLVQDITTSALTVQLGASGWLNWDTSGQIVIGNWGTTYTHIKVVVIG